MDMKMTIVLSLLLTTMIIGCMGNPTSQRTGLADLLTSYKRGYKEHCSSYYEECIPEKNNCCGHLQCLNSLDDLCLYPLERCFCTNWRVYNARIG